jgi:hypothetical protein
MPWPTPPLYHRTTPSVFKLYILAILIVHGGRGGGAVLFCHMNSENILNHEFCTYRRRRRRRREKRIGNQ